MIIIVIITLPCCVLHELSLGEGNRCRGALCWQVSSTFTRHAVDEDGQWSQGLISAVSSCPSPLWPQLSFTFLTLSICFVIFSFHFFDFFFSYDLKSWHEWHVWPGLNKMVVSHWGYKLQAKKWGTDYNHHYILRIPVLSEASRGQPDTIAMTVIDTLLGCVGLWRDTENFQGHWQRSDVTVGKSYPFFNLLTTDCHTKVTSLCGTRGTTKISYWINSKTLSTWVFHFLKSKTHTNNQTIVHIVSTDHFE